MGSIKGVFHFVDPDIMNFTTVYQAKKNCICCNLTDKYQLVLNYK